MQFKCAHLSHKWGKKVTHFTRTGTQNKVNATHKAEEVSERAGTAKNGPWERDLKTTAQSTFRTSLCPSIQPIGLWQGTNG